MKYLRKIGGGRGNFLTDKNAGRYCLNSDFHDLIDLSDDPHIP
jgi:hypothetical protein